MEDVPCRPLTGKFLAGMFLAGGGEVVAKVMRTSVFVYKRECIMGFEMAGPVSVAIGL